MKILIIGGSSIVGFKMLEFLREKKVNVEYTYYSNNINIENGHYLDIRNKDDVLKLIRKIKPTVVAIPTIFSAHQDHTFAYKVSISALRPHQQKTMHMPELVISYEAPDSRKNYPPFWRGQL